MRQFRWLAAGSIPAALDLRRRGWRLRDDGPGGAQICNCPLLALPSGLPLSDWLALTTAPAACRRSTAMLGIDDPLQRSRLLRMGFGEALGWGASLDELEARLERLIERAGAVQRRRQVGALLLDLVAREAFVAGRALGLHPREFDLLWRLADDPGEELSATVLLGDVWRLRFRPETNSLAVHVSRLRAKLRLAGLDGLIETTSAGGYRLAAKQEPRWRGVAAAPPLGNLALDAHLRLREERLCEDS